jgi:sugar/nucleoside kinase (ribokinase family)
MADHVTGSQIETLLLSCAGVGEEAVAKPAATERLEGGVKDVVVALRPKGCFPITPDGAKPFPARKAKTLDATAAAHAFDGAYTSAPAKDTALHDAIPFANAVAIFVARRTERTHSAMPAIVEIEALLSSPAGSITPPWFCAT